MESGPISLKPDLERVQRRLIIDEFLLRALLISHLLPELAWIKEYKNEIEDVTFDKAQKQVTITFSKEKEEVKDA